MRKPMMIAAMGAALVLAALGVSCGPVGAGAPGATDATAADDATGVAASALRVFLVDAPLDEDVAGVWVDIAWVDLHHVPEGASDDEEEEGGSWLTVVEGIGPVDLLELRHGARMLLGEVALAKGTVTQLRLFVDSAEVALTDGTREPVTIPSANQTGIKLVGGVAVDPDQPIDLVLDFDAEESLHRTGPGQWIMRPTIRISAIAADGVEDDDLVLDEGPEIDPDDHDGDSGG